MIIDRNCSCMNSGDRCYERLLFIHETCWSSNISWSLFPWETATTLWQNWMFEKTPQASQGPSHNPVREPHHCWLLFCHLCRVVNVHLSQNYHSMGKTFNPELDYHSNWPCALGSKIQQSYPPHPTRLSWSHLEQHKTEAEQEHPIIKMKVSWSIELQPFQPCPLSHWRVLS